MLLILVCAVADLAQAVDEHRPCQAVAGFARIQFLPSRAAQLRVADPAESEQRAFQPSQFTQRGGGPVLCGWPASCRMLSDAATIPVRMGAATRRISDQCARMRRPASANADGGWARGTPEAGQCGGGLAASLQPTCRPGLYLL